MAKKGGQQQLQAEINTDEEFEKFLERPGLLVLDVYSEWCGPCLGMVGSLKKIKLELGGDNLNLGICKSDGITALERFRNKSEPSWLFVVQGKAVNLMFGTNVPKLIQLITKELELLPQRDERHVYEITELQPEEQERFRKINAAEEHAKKIELEAVEKKRRDYLNYVTDVIMETLPECGVTIFGPHINRDMLKKIMEPADKEKISCKDRKVITLTPDQIEVLHFACPNPIEPDVLEQIYNKELLLCYWKVADDDKRSVEEILQSFAFALVKPQSPVDEYGNINQDITLPAVLTSLEIKIKPQIHIPSLEEVVAASTATVSKIEIEVSDDPLANLIGDMPGTDDENATADGDEEKKDEDGGEKEKSGSSIQTKSSEGSKKEISEEVLKTIIVPAVWTPGNRRTNAAAIYLFFRQQTASFLPPDPVPEPPHLIISFDAYKKKEVSATFRKYEDEIMLYGYFTSEDPESAKLVANSTKNYEKKSPNITDKLVVKVAKQTSHALLALVANNPSYVSPNTVIGAEEALKFFPKGYKTGEMEEAEAGAENEAEKKKKKKKKKKGAEGEGSETTIGEGEADTGDNAAAEEEKEQGDEAEGEQDEGADASPSEGESPVPPAE